MVDKNLQLNDTLYFRRTFAQSKVVVETTKNESGAVRANTSLNAEKISDTTRQYLQGCKDFKDFKYDTLYNKAVQDLEATFERLGLNNGKTYREKKKNKRKKNIAISNWIEEYIRVNFPTVIKVDFDKFIESTRIKRAQGRINNALQILANVQNTNYYEIEHPSIDLQTGELSIGVSRINSLPRITLWLDESLEGKGYSLETFAQADIKNKRELIKGLEIELNPMYLFHVVGIGNDYVASKKSKRDKLRHIVSFKLDILLSSLNNKERKGTFDYPVDDLKKQLGAKESMEYRYLNRDYLKKGIEDLNTHLGRKISYKPIKEGRTVKYIRFSIDNEVDGLEHFIFHYISSQLYYFSEIYIEDVKKFANFLKSRTNKSDELHGQKTMAEWISEAEKEYIAEVEILNMQQADAQFFEKNNIIYDKNKHIILQEIEELTNKTNEEKKYAIIRNGDSQITKPSDSLKYLQKLEAEFLTKSVHIMDFIPFAYASVERKWVKVDSMDMVIKYKDVISKDIALKNYDKFSFEEEDRKKMFIYYAEKNLFAEITQSVKKKIQTLFDC